MNTDAVLRMHMLTVRSSQLCIVISSAEKCHKKNASNPWARSLNIYERCSLLFPPTLHAVFAKHSKIRNHTAENVSNFGREKNKTSNFEM